MFTAYQVTITDVAPITGALTISAPANVLNHTGDFTFQHNTPTYRLGYTNYAFNSANHYFDTDGNSFTGTPANATVGGYTWSISDNAYATMSTGGVVTVNSMPQTDEIVTVTLTANVTGGTPAVSAGTTLTATQEVTILGSLPIKPDIAVSGSTATITTDAAGTPTIRYTLDGSNPTASTGTVYSGAIDLSSSTTSPITIKAVTVRDGNVSDVTTRAVTLTIPAPTITTDGAAGTATISSSLAGATIYYTTDGTTPTTSSSVYTGALSSLSAMTTVKAIAVKSGWNNSAVASEQLTIPSGVSGGTVTLFDYEDHTWTYYKGVDASVDGGNYNSNYDGKLYSPNPRNVMITYKGNGGAVAWNAPETEFVYYKTIEKVNGKYTYTLIPNPFSKRPTEGTGNTRWRGFSTWRVVSVDGGTITSSDGNTTYSANSTIPAETEICFNPTRTYTTNCQSMEVEFEAVWVQAYVATSVSTNGLNGSSYETNFVVLTSGTTNSINNFGRAATISALYPNGTTDGTNAPAAGWTPTTGISGTFSCSNNTKVEYIRMSGSGTITANNKYLILGRGIIGGGTNGLCSGTVQGMTNTASSAQLNYHIRIESGIYNYLTFTNGYGSSYGTNPGNNYNNSVVAFSSNNNFIRGTLGCDYDRATSNNTLLKVQQEMFYGYYSTFSNTGNASRETFNVVAKSGDFCSAKNNDIADAEESFYASLGGQQTNVGRRVLTIEGGQFLSIAGGIDQNNSASDESFFIRMKGGTLRGALYGSGAFAASSGIRRMIVTGGRINGWIAAGCNGTDPNQAGGTLPSDTYVYIGGKSHVGNNTDITINTSSDGNVFGAGSGNSAQATTGQVNNSNVVIADNCYVKNNAYGGGNYGYSNAKATVYVTGGEVAGSVFGGSNQKQGVNVEVNMTGGQVDKGVYGGSNVTGTISGSVTMNINGGQVGTSSQTANIHGGGYGSATRVSQNVDITLGKTGQTEPGVTVYGDVYGGSALGSVNGTEATNTYHTNVTMNKGIINGSLYGGGLGNGSTAANVYGPVAVKVYGGSVKKTSVDGSGGVYGGNNVNGAPQRSVTVDIYGTDPAPAANQYALYAVYGGGNAADYTYGNGYPTVTVHNCDNSIEYVYGGGNAAAVAATNVIIWGGNKIGNVFGGGNGTVTAANVNGNAVTKIYGGTIGKVFGGSNSQGTISGSISVTVQKQDGDSDPDGSATACAMHIDEVYGGGNMAASQAGSITIGCTGDQGEGIGDVYGGANQANIGTAQNPSNIALNITGGSINRVFGGNNVSGTINGTITVNVNWTTTNPCGYNYLGSVFGAGNLAQYTIPSGKTLAVNILNGTVSGNVYGGGKGDPNDHTKGQVTGNPVVTIGDNVNGHTAVVSGDVYGGGDAGNVVGTPQVNVINKCNTSIANVYGGGNAADVNGTDVNIDGGNITGMVFGGGHGDKTSNPQKEANVNGNVAVDVTGGTINKVFGGSNSKGTISGSVAVNIAKGTNSCEMHITEVYGGGNEAAGNAGTITIGCTGGNNEGIVDVYGGANAADISNDIALTIKGGNIQRVFGGNNQSGSISGTIAVEVNWDSSLNCGMNYLGSVFGGGNVAAYSGSPTVTLTNGTVSHSVYGGGNEAGVGGSLVNINGGSVIDGVYGGCNTSGNVSGNIVVNINGGTLGTSSAALTSGIFGGGFGKNTTTAGNVTVNVGDANAASAAATSTIYGDIYGGSALGTVNDAVADETTVNFNNGTIHGNIYGGGLGAAKLNSNGYIDDTQPKTEAIVNGTVHVNIGTSTQASNFVTINGQVFGCNNLAGTPKGPVYVDVYHTAHTAANAYPSTEPATAADVTQQASSAFAIGAVYGGGNLAHYTTTVTDASTHVTIHGCDNTIEYVYGGGNAANSPATEVIIEGGRFNYIFGGGNGAGTGNPGANIAGDAVATLYGGIVYRAFGGSNTKGNIGGASQVNLPDVVPTGMSTCTRLVHEIFGGGNEAPGGNVDMVIPCGTTGTGIVYAGANRADMGTQADFEAGRPVLIKLTVEGGDFTQVFGGNNESGTIWGNVELHLKGGTIANAFGGNNLGGDIKGWIKVYVEDAESPSCPLILTNVYGGGYNAAYTPVDATQESPVVYVNHIKSGNKILGNVFGGGYGEPATVTANPVVYIGNTEAGHDSDIATIAGNVYGGGNAAKVVNSTTVLIQKDNTVIEGRVFGAGKGSDSDPTVASVDKNTTVTMTGGWVKTNIYGGGEMASVGTYTRDAQNAITAVTANTGTTTVTISGGIVGPDGLNPTDIDGHGNVFGGGLGKAGSDYSNSAYVNTSQVDVSNGTVRGSVFGGGENGHVKGDTHVTIGGGEVGVRVIHEYRDIQTDFGSGKPLYAGNVYGGGRGVDHTAVGNHLSETAGRVYGNTNVSVTGGHIYHAVYGGGSLASVGTYTLTENSSVFGGHLHNFTAGTGNATVEISGGRIGPSWDDLYYDDSGNSLVNASGVPVNDPAKATIARNFECLGENEGMVYGSGRGMNYPNDNNTDHRLYVEMAFTNNTFVTIKGDNTEVVGSVFGGGENGHVKGNTQVNIQGGTIGGFRLHHNGFYLPGHMNEAAYFIEDTNVADDEMTVDVNGTGKVIFRGNVYGGGRGVDHINAQDPTQAQQIYSISAGRVYGNTVVNVTGGHVLHNVFGGGSIASVGTYSYPVSGGNPQFLNENPESCWANTGKATVNVTGGMVGQMGENEGFVYGGGRGVAGSSDAQVKHLAYVNETEVKIGTGSGTHADVRGSVFGGGMNGHVLTDTHVTVSGGVVGGKTDEDYGTYDTVNFPLADKPTQADYTIDGVSYYCGIIKGDMVLSEEGVGAHTVYLGNVYGGGRGVDHYGASNTNLSRTAGRVYGNTNLTVTGGVIYHSIFGGGSIASVGTYTLYTAAEAAADAAKDERYRITEGQPKECVGGGTATVTVTGGRIGTDGHNNGRVFGSSRGMAGTNYRGLGYVNKTNVTIGTSGASTGPEVRGSVFGSGENGHVLTTTQVNIESGHIGNGKATTVTDQYVGNVYGGGRGLDRAVSGGETVSPFAGRVYGATTVNVRGGQIDHNVYGGGSLASVGRFKRYMANTSDERYNTITYADANVGICYVNVSGGTIGIDGDNNGHVFGSSRGTAASHRDILASLAYVSDTRVTISGGTVKGSVFGGGESGHVQRDATVTVSGGTIGSAIPKDYSACTDAEKEMYDLMGNVYGAGRGVDTYEDNNGVEQYSFSAGYVRGNTTVEITGGTIHRNVYGGGSMGIVGDYGPYGRNDFFEGDPATNGLAKVTIKSAVGTADDVAYGYGGNVFGSSRGKANDPVNDSTHDFAEMSYCFQTQVNVDTGADVLGNVYGGGENGHVDYAGTTVTVKNGRVRGNVFGGGKGNISSATAGIIDGPTRVLIGTSEQQTNTVVIAGDVFAGNDTHSSPLGEMRVDVYKANAALNNVYGGGNLANVLTGVAANDVTTGYAVMNTDYITQRIEQTASSTPLSFKPWPGGTSRKSIVYVHTGDQVIANVFGGGKMANCKLTEVTIDGGVTTDVYGGGEQGEVTETTRVDLVSGTVTNAYGGGLGKKNGFFGSTEDVAADVGGNVIVNLNGGSSVTSPSNNCVVKGSIFGCNNLNGTPKGHVTVHIYKTQGWTDHDVTTGKADATIAKGTGVYEVAAVYGGGNMAAYVPTSGTETTDVIIDGCDLTSIEYVYGGGNAASVPAAQVTVNGTYEIGTIFGGGNGKDALPNGDPNPGAHVGYKANGTTAYGTGNANVYLFGGTIHNAFGASNTLGNIAGKAEVHVDEKKNGTTPICPLVLDELYGGGNEAYMEGGTNIDLGCVTYLKTIYGGAKNANVNGDINLTITSGHFDRVFGGNNLGGTISGTITVNIEETGCNPITIGELYGCGNQAAFGDASNPKTPTINVKSFTSIGRIFGGGLGNTAIVTGNPTVNINEVVGENANNTTWAYHQETVAGKLVGKTITYSDGTSVTMPTHETGNKIGSIGTVFGGGNAAKVVGNTNVKIGTQTTISYESGSDHTAKTVVGADIRGNVFGGGNAAEVTGNTNVEIGQKK